MTTPDHSRKSQRLSSQAKSTAAGKHVVVTFKNVPVVSKEAHRALADLARDPVLTKKRSFSQL